MPKWIATVSPRCAPSGCAEDHTPRTRASTGAKIVDVNAVLGKPTRAQAAKLPPPPQARGSSRSMLSRTPTKAQVAGWHRR